MFFIYLFPLLPQLQQEYHLKIIFFSVVKEKSKGNNKLHLSER